MNPTTSRAGPLSPAYARVPGGPGEDGGASPQSVAVRGDLIERLKAKADELWGRG
jgi:hypothetical protein